MIALGSVFLFALRISGKSFLNELDLVDNYI
jgi:hypothetical protein